MCKNHKKTHLGFDIRSWVLDKPGDAQHLRPGADAGLGEAGPEPFILQAVRMPEVGDVWVREIQEDAADMLLIFSLQSADKQFLGEEQPGVRRERIYRASPVTQEAFGTLATGAQVKLG